MEQIITRHKNKKTYLDPNTMKPHRVDGPAIIFDQGSEEWWQNGLRHRDGDAAFIKVDKNKITKEWWCNGKLHREDGPAIEIFSTNDNLFEYHPKVFNYKNHVSDYLLLKRVDEWWVNGVRHRDGRPAIIGNGGVEFWIRNGKPHRIGGPAIVGTEGEAWYLNGRLHREGKPAIVSNTRNEWFRRNKHYRPDGPTEISVGYGTTRMAWHDEDSDVYTKEVVRYSTGEINVVLMNKKGEYFSLDGPATISTSALAWYEYPGVQCRADGPCLIYANPKVYNADKVSTYYCYKPNGRRYIDYDESLKSLSREEQTTLLFAIDNISEAKEKAKDIYFKYVNEVEDLILKYPFIKWDLMKG